jgi:Autotransporter beta-domain
MGDPACSPARGGFYLHRIAFAGAVVSTMAALSLLSRPARAGDRTHDGFQFRGTVGFGYISDAESSNETLQGGAGVLEVYLGGMPTPGLAIGGFLSGASAIGPSVRVNGFRASSSDTSLTLATIGPYIDYYPSPRKGFHILGTLGFARLTLSFDDGTISADDSGTGFTLGGGVGYDWWVSRDWTIGILGRFTFASTSRTFDGLSVSESTFLPAVLFSVSFN